MAGQAEHERVFKELGGRLKALRQKSGQSQEDMLSFGFSTRHWQQIEAGRPITLKTLLRICDVFAVTPERLLRGLYVGIGSDDLKRGAKRSGLSRGQGGQAFSGHSNTSER